MDSPYYDWETHHALYNSLNMLHANISSMDINHNKFFMVVHGKRTTYRGL